jgi:hypothetical protein
MDIEQILKDVRDERNRVVDAIISLEKLQALRSGAPKGPGRPPMTNMQKEAAARARAVKKNSPEAAPT